MFLNFRAGWKSNERKPHKKVWKSEERKFKKIGKISLMPYLPKINQKCKF